MRFMDYSIAIFVILLSVVFSGGGIVILSLVSTLHTLSYVQTATLVMTAIIQGMQSIVVIFAMIYAKGQAEEASRGRKLQATRELINEIGNEEIRADRFWVLRKMPEACGLTSREVWRARRVAVAYDRVGYMVRQKLIPEDILYDWQKDEIEQLWKKLKPIIDDERKFRSHHCQHFQYLAEVWFKDMGKKHEEKPKMKEVLKIQVNKALSTIIAIVIESSKSLLKKIRH